MTDLAIRIATTMDATGLNKADKQVKSFERTVKNLGRTLGVTLSAAAIVQFGRKSVQAFIADEKAVVKLNTSLKNLGLELAAPAVTQYIDSLSRATAVADDQLRPAFQALINTTGSLTASQQLLSQAIDISAGSGIALETVAQDLANAYVGQTRGLRKYNLGLTQAQLKTASFEELMARLNKQFSGANAAFLDTYAGKLQALGVAGGEAQEAIGGAIIDLAMALSGASDIDQLITRIESLTDKIVGMFDAFTEGIAIIKAILGAKTFQGMFDAAQKAQVDEYNRRMRRDYMKPWQGVNMPKSSAQIAAEKAAEAAAKKRAGDQLKETKKLTAEQKRQNALKKAGTLFDLDQIQIIAALKGQISADDRKRLELQLALATENVSEVEKLGKQLAISQGLGTDLAKFLVSLPSAKNPFEAWKGFLDGLEAQAARIANMKPQTGNFQYTIPTGNFTYGQGNPLNTDVFVDPRGAGGAGAGGSTVVVNVAGSVTTSQNLIDEIRGGLNVAALSGSSANVERRIGGW
jgi:hypothetical protein